MTGVLVVGAGAVGARAARQLAESEGIDRVFITDVDRDRATSVARAVGRRLEVIEWSANSAPPEPVVAIACAVPAGEEFAVAQRAVHAGIPSVSTVDDHEAIRSVLTLDVEANRAGVPVLVGCGLAPGLSELLARHASADFDVVEEVHVSRSGIAGPASEVTVRRALRDKALEWRAGDWREVAHRVGHELVWFPDPIGARECELVAGGIWSLVEAFSDAARISERWSSPPPVRRAGVLRRPVDEASWGAARVEVWGTRGTARESIVYGVIERTAAAAATVLALSTLAVIGKLPGHRSALPAGVHGLATAEPIPFLAELARRGVKAAVFEGVAVS